MKFQPTEYPLPIGTVVDASAGTGKTYAVAAHVALALAVDEDLSIGQILITTFTRNAAAELRDRVRRRIIATAELLRGLPPERPDALDEHMLAAGADQRATWAGRLERAAAEFDTATIATIHGVCSKVLKFAGIAVEGNGQEDVRERIVAEVVNDELVKQAVAGRLWDEPRMRRLVDEALHDFFMQPWLDPDLPAEVAGRLDGAVPLVDTCIRRVRDAMRSQPGFDDLLRLAWEQVTGPGGEGLVSQLRERYRLAIVDEAQDTDALQWRFFHRLFPGTDGRRLISVGDPKQAIYGFRGADVSAYVEFTRLAERRTLDVNRRTDRPVLDVLNRVMKDATFFGAEVAYEAVEADERNLEPRIVGAEPVEFLDVGPVSNQSGLVGPVARKVVELLGGARLRPADPQAEPRRLDAGDICVLVRTNWVGNAVAAQLGRVGIRAVCTGTMSVMRGQMAEDLRALVEAMERPSSPGRIRRVAATLFFGGHSLRDAGSLSDQAIRPVQETVARLAAILQRHGIAACAAEISADLTMMANLTAGLEGERHVADFAHIVELLHEHGTGRGCRPDELLDVFLRLSALTDQSELVSRRVESDDDAVKVMTIHAAKGLEFPCVIVADLWKAADERDAPLVFHRGADRVIDVAYAVGAASAAGAMAVGILRREERKRLLYVAVTRAKHHLCVITATTDDETVLPEVLRHVDATRPVTELPGLPDRWTPGRPLDDADLVVAPMPAGGVRQTYRRTSFSGITAARSHTEAGGHVPSGGGYDEPAAAAGVERAGGHELRGEPEAAGATAAFALPDLPAGTAFGSVVHEIFEALDTSRPLADEVRNAVAALATSRMFTGRHALLAETILRALQTPFGGPFGDVCLADIPPADRLAEMDFEMALADLDTGVLASDVGRVLDEQLSAADPLRAYAAELRHPSFDIPLAGLINGSIDAVLRLPGGTATAPRLVIVDYKTNKLHTREMPHPEEAYAPARLADAMAAHHYPLQALVYGTAVYRMVRWRLKLAAAEDCIAGVVYGFIRGTRGPGGPADAEGRRHGMFAWQPPRSVWPRLSSLFAGDRP